MMDLIFNMLLTLAVAAGCGLLFRRIGIPGGMLVGALFGTVALGLFTGQAYIFPELRVLAQSVTGAYIGCLVTREDLMRLPQVFKPFLLAMALFLMMNLAVGFLLYQITDMSPITALLSAAPGGISDIPLIALDMGADVSVVAVLQFVRMIFGMGALPGIILLSDRLIEPEEAKRLEEQEQQAYSGTAQSATAKIPLKPFLPIFAVAILGGILGKASGLPAGTISASLIVVLGVKLAGKSAPMPPWLRRVAQVVAGCCVGVSISREQIFALGGLIVPALITMAGYTILCILGGLILSRVFKMGLREAMLSLSPAGASEMALIAADLGVHSPNLLVLQIGRLLGVIVIFPHIFSLILSLVG